MSDGQFVAKDLPADLAQSNNAFAAIVEALDRRRRAGTGPFTVLSCDNVQENGHVARTATLGVAGLVRPESVEWIQANVAFPNSMVDRITPATTEADRAWLRETHGLEDLWPVATEPFRQWVLEDTFAAGRPRWEEVGAVVTSDVRPYEAMKLRLLNAGHSALAYPAALAGIEFVHDAASHSVIQRFVRGLMNDEVTPTLTPPAGVDLEQYKTTLIERFTNSAVGDQIARLCLDGTVKWPKFLIPTIEAQIVRGGPVRLAATALAGWCKYLRGVKDDGTALVLSADPFLAEAQEHAKRFADDPQGMLSYERVFGPVLPKSTRFVETFARAVAGFREGSALAALEAAAKG